MTWNPILEMCSLNFQNMLNMNDGWTDAPCFHSMKQTHMFLAQSSTSGELTIWLEKQAFYPPFEMLDELEVR